MRVVLGVDAAWTVGQPSGVAVAVDRGAGWCLAAVAPSYAQFEARARGLPIGGARPVGSVPDAGRLIGATVALCGAAPDVVAIDMPLSRLPIAGRRESDNAVSRAYGARRCGTHTPSVMRPGPISDALRQGFGDAGYPLLTSAPAAAPGLAEVYPHPALVEFARASMRLTYKAAKVRTYWPGHTPHERRDLLFAQWRSIVAVLDARVSGVADALPAPPTDASGIARKAYEDRLDAVVCACVAICILDGEAIPYGDDASCIWIPRASAALDGRAVQVQ